MTFQYETCEEISKTVTCRLNKRKEYRQNDSAIRCYERSKSQTIPQALIVKLFPYLYLFHISRKIVDKQRTAIFHKNFYKFI